MWYCRTNWQQTACTLPNLTDGVEALFLTSTVLCHGLLAVEHLDSVFAHFLASHRLATVQHIAMHELALCSQAFELWEACTYYSASSSLDNCGPCIANLDAGSV